MKFLGSIAAVATALWCSAAVAEPRNVRFEKISVEPGLSQGVVNAVLQDRDGFVWFATQDGLNRFDGYEFTVFKHDPDNANSLSYNVVWTILEAKDGKLWIATDGGGVDVWDPETRKFTNLRSVPDDPKSLSGDRVRTLLETRNGEIWLGTDSMGLNRFDPKTGTFQRFKWNPEHPNSITSDRIRHLYEDRQGHIWIATDGGGLNVLDVGRQTFRAYRFDPKNPRGLNDDRVRWVFEDRDGILWIGTYTGGVNRLDRKSATFTHYQTVPGDPTSLSNNNVRSVFQDSAGTIWVGTDGGLNEWVPETQTFVRYVHSPTDPYSLPEDKIMTIQQDRGGVLWLGTFGNGVAKWNATTTFFALHRVDPQSRTTLSSNAVQAFAADRTGTVWIGTVAGLNRLDRKTGTYKVYRQSPRGLSDDRIYSLLLDRQGALWIGTYEFGVNRFDPKTETFTRFTHDPADPGSFSGNGATSILEDRAGRIWIGSYRAGLNRLDPGRSTFAHYAHDPQSPTSLSSNQVVALREDSLGGLWVATDDAGLNRLDPATGAVTRYRHDAAVSTSLASDALFSLYEDRRGNLWVGTRGAGLDMWSAEDRKAGRVIFKHYTERQGLANDTVYGILEDESGDLWMSTARGLSRFNVRAELFHNFDRAHGLQSTDFNFGAYHRAPWGEMFFGGPEGFNSFFPERLNVNSPPPPVALTAFHRLGQRVELGKDLTRVKEIHLTHRDYVVSFDFAALDFAAPAKNRYAYKLEGLDRDWIPTGGARRATYTNLAPGNYTFRVKAANGDGAWNEEGASVRVLVAPPWWRTWWAYLLYVVGAAGVLRLYTRRHEQKLAREAEYSRKLEDQVRWRTAELARRNEDLEVANRKLEDASLTDSLTGLNNRRFLMTHIQKDVALVERRGHGVTGPTRADFALLMIDLDGLKAVNDNYGHAMGDRALIQMRELLENACRKSDTIVRWGGDEFLVVGRFADPHVAASLAERVRKAVEEHPFDLGLERPVHLGCSIGWAMFPFFYEKPMLLSWEQVATIADRALYVAKRSGRNAWVGFLSTAHAPDRNIVHLINQRPESLVREELLEVRTSLPDPADLVWEREAALASAR